MSSYILFTDDDQEDRGLIRDCFNSLGLDDAIVFIEDGLSLINYLSAENAGQVGLIVLDLNMPKLNGTETLRAIKNIPSASQIPVIIFSTSVNEIEKKNCLELGALEYITKPLRWENYVDACRHFLEIANPQLTD